jgi:hypothetical protein
MRLNQRETPRKSVTKEAGADSPAVPVNGARAIMAARKERADSLDFFPTPPYATRALIEHVLPVLGVQQSDLSRMIAWEPAFGEGHMAEPLAEYFGQVIATDIFDYGYGARSTSFPMALLVMLTG